MDFLEKIFSTTTQEPKDDERFARLIKQAIGGNSSEINPNYLYQLQSYCKTKENAIKIMNAFSHALNEHCDSPLPIFKSLKLILLLLKLSAQTFAPAVRNYLPEIQTFVHVSFDKPGAPHVNTIHRFANVIYLHLSKNIPLPEMKIPPRPKQNSAPSQNQNQRQPQRPGHSRLDNNDEGSLFDSNDNNINNDNSKYEESGSFLSGFMDLGPKRRLQQQKQQQQQAQQPSRGPQDQEGPRMPAVFASGGAFQGIRSRISQPLDYGYEDEDEIGKETGESLLSFNGDSNSNDQSNDLLVGAFDDIGNDIKNNNDNSSMDQTNFVFSGAEPASSNQENTDLNAPFNPFGADGFNPTFPNIDDFDKNNDVDKPSNSYRRPFVASGPKPKFDPSKMKKKPKIVPNTVPQDNFDPFGTGSAANAFDNISKEPQNPPKKLSLAERLGQKPELLKQEEPQKKPQQPGKNVFDLLGFSGSESDDGKEAETTSPSITKPAQVSSQNQSQKGSSNVFDALGDDFGKIETTAEEKQDAVSGDKLFQPFGSTPELQKELDQTKQQKNSSVNLFDMLGDESFNTPVEQNQQNQLPTSHDLFGSFDSPTQNKQQPNNDQQPPKNSSANVFDMLGDDAFTTNSNSSQKTEPAKSDLFEPFNPSSQQSPQQKKLNEDNKQQQTNSKEDLFEPFGSTSQQTPQQQTGSKNDLFEPFGSSTQQQPQQPQKSSGNVFDMLDGNDFNEPTTSNQKSNLQTKNSTADDLFESFGSTPSTQAQQPPPKNSSANVFDMLGDDSFTTTPSPPPKTQPSTVQDDLFEPFGSSHTQQQKQQQVNSNNDLFEPIGTSTQDNKQQQVNSDDNLFEPLDNTTQQQQPNSKDNIFEPFDSTLQQTPQQQTGSKNDLFEPFGSSTQQQPQQPQKSSGNVFDMLDGNDFNEPTTSNQKSNLQTKNSTADDLFESFGSTPSTQAQQPPPKNSSANVFDMLGDDMFTSNPAPSNSKGGTTSNDLFDSFASVPTTTPPHNSANIFDMLDSTNNTAPKSSGASKSTNPYDIFG